MFGSNRLEPGEKILYQAKASKMAWINAILIFAALFHVSGLFSLTGTSVTLTNKRLYGRAGMFGRKSINLRHDEIEMVGVRRGLLGKFMTYGNVVVTSKGGDRIVFKAIANPLVLQQEVDEAVEIAMLGRKLSDFDQPAAPPPAPLAARDRTMEDFDRLAERKAAKEQEPPPAMPSTMAQIAADTPRPRVNPDQW